jgi:hypothetical protein
VFESNNRPVFCASDTTTEEIPRLALEGEADVAAHRTGAEQLPDRRVVALAGERETHASPRRRG